MILYNNTPSILISSVLILHNNYNAFTNFGGSRFWSCIVIRHTRLNVQQRYTYNSDTRSRSSLILKIWFDGYLNFRIFDIFSIKWTKMVPVNNKIRQRHFIIYTAVRVIDKIHQRYFNAKLLSEILQTGVCGRSNERIVYRRS